MTSSDLTTSQTEKLRDKVAADMRYYKALQERMQEQGFPPDDILYQAVVRSHHSLHATWVHLHYLSCGPTFKGPGAE